MPIEIKELIVKGTVDELKNKSTTEISKIIQDKIMLKKKVFPKITNISKIEEKMKSQSWDYR